MEPTKKGVKQPYYLIKADDQVIFIVSKGSNGSEFNKTEGFFNDYPGISSFKCLYGQGILIMQRNNEVGEAKEFKVITLHPGRGLAVPAAWAMCLINIGRNFLVVLQSGATDTKYQDTKPILDKHGLAYYVVEKKGEIGFEPNPNYSVHPQIATE